MAPEQARPGTWVRVMRHHRVKELRGLVGTVVAVYGGKKYVAVDLRLVDGQCRLFWPQDLQEVSIAPPSWWRSLFLVRTIF